MEEHRVDTQVALVFTLGSLDSVCSSANCHKPNATLYACCHWEGPTFQNGWIWFGYPFLYGLVNFDKTLRFGQIKKHKKRERNPNKERHKSKERANGLIEWILEGRWIEVGSLIGESLLVKLTLHNLQTSTASTTSYTFIKWECWYDTWECT